MKHLNSSGFEYLGILFLINHGFLMSLDMKHYFFVAIIAHKDARNPKIAATTGFNHFVTNKEAKISLFSKSSKVTACDPDFF